jgi:hypothetical protein
MAKLEMTCKRCSGSDFLTEIFERSACLRCCGCGDDVEILQPEHREIGHVYFIGATDGPIKIGYTSKAPEQRVKEIQTGNPERLKVLAKTPGSQRLETAFHAIFATQRMVGEWFRRTPELARLVEAYHGVAPIVGGERAMAGPPMREHEHRLPLEGEILPPPKRKNGRPRKYEEMPWNEVGVSKATWYRRFFPLAIQG